MSNKISQDQMNNFKNAINKVQLNENMNFMGMGQPQMPSRPPMGQMGQQRRRMPMGQMGQPPMGQGRPPMGQMGQQPPMGGFGGGQPPMGGGQPPMGGFGGSQPPMMGQMGQQPPKALGQQQDAMKMPGMGGPSSQTVSAQDQFGALEEPEPSMFGGQPPMMGQGQPPMGGFGGGQPPMMGQGRPPMGQMGQQPPMGGFGGGQPPMMGQRRRRPQGGFGDMSMYGESFNQNKKKI